MTIVSARAGARKDCVIVDTPRALASIGGMRWLLVAMLTSSCGRVIADCFCEPGHLELAEAVNTRGAVELGPVPRGCGRIDPVHVSNPIFRTIPALSIVAARSSNPAVQIGFPSTSVSTETILALQVVTEAGLDAPDAIEAEVELETDTGTPRLLTFQVRAQVRPAEAPGLPPLDFGGVALGSTGALAVSLADLAPLATDFGFHALTGTGFDFATPSPPPGFELRFSPLEAGRHDGALRVDAFRHCPAFETLTLVGDGVDAVLTVTPASLDFGVVPVGETRTLTVSVDNAGLVPSSVFAPHVVTAFDGAFPQVPGATRDRLGALVRGHTSAEVRFSPRAAGEDSQTLHFPTSLASGRWLELQVRGFGR